MIRALLLVAGIAFLVYLIVDLGPGQIAALLARIGWGFLPLAGIYGVYQLVRAMALKLSAARPAAVPFRDVLAIRLSGEAVQFLTSTGPFLAEPSKAVLLGKRGLTKIEGFAATAVEYLSYTFVSSVMLAGAMAYMLTSPSVALGPNLRLTAMVLLVVSVVFLGVAAVAIYRRIYLIGGVMRWLGRLPGIGRRIGAEAGAVRDTEDVLLGVLRENPVRFAQILFVEAVAHALLVVELWWILRMTDVTPGFGDALVHEAAGKFIAMAFFFIPGQIGAAEGVNVLLFEALGLPGVAGVGVALARRIRSMLAAGAGLAALAIVTRRS